MVADHQGSSTAIDEMARQRSPVFEVTREGPPQITGHPTTRGQSPRTASRGGCVSGQSSSGEIGGGNGSSGRDRPYVFAFARGIARKRIVSCQAEVSQAQEALAKAQSKLQQEEQGLTDEEARLATLMQESAEGGPRREEVPPAIPADFAHELAELRTCLSELRRENMELRSQLSSRSGEERERKQPRNLASSTLDLAPLSRVSVDHAGRAICQSVPMQTPVCVPIVSTRSRVDG